MIAITLALCAATKFSFFSAGAQDQRITRLFTVQISIPWKSASEYTPPVTSRSNATKTFVSPCLGFVKTDLCKSIHIF